VPSARLEPRRAAEQGFAAAQYILGVLYRNGQGVTRDYTLAYMWINLAASKLSGEVREDLVKARDAVAGRLTPEQLRRAQEMARDWKPTKPGGK
jgi:uncharacterized protein